jgi:hypothetical protein
MANSTSSDDIGLSGDHRSGDMNRGRFHTTLALERVFVQGQSDRIELLAC